MKSVKRKLDEDIYQNILCSTSKQIGESVDCFQKGWTCQHSIEKDLTDCLTNVGNKEILNGRNKL